MYGVKVGVKGREDVKAKPERLYYILNLNLF